MEGVPRNGAPVLEPPIRLAVFGGALLETLLFGNYGSPTCRPDLQKTYQATLVLSPGHDTRLEDNDPLV